MHELPMQVESSQSIDRMARAGPAGHTGDEPILHHNVSDNSFTKKVRELFLSMRVKPGYVLNAQTARGIAVELLKSETPSISEVAASIIAAQNIEGSHLFAGILLSAAYEFSTEKNITYNLVTALPLAIDFGHLSSVQALIIEQPTQEAKINGAAVVVNDSSIETLWRGFPYGLTINRGVINGCRRRKDNLSKSRPVRETGLIINLGEIHNTVHGSVINFGAKPTRYNKVHLEYLVDWHKEPYRQAKLPIGVFFKNQEGPSVEIFIGRKRPSTPTKICVRNVVVPPNVSSLAQYLDELHAKLQQPALEVTAYLRTLIPEGKTVPDPANYIKDHIFMLAKVFLPGGLP